MLLVTFMLLSPFLTFVIARTAAFVTLLLDCYVVPCLYIYLLDTCLMQVQLYICPCHCMRRFSREGHPRQPEIILEFVSWVIPRVSSGGHKTCEIISGHLGPWGRDKLNTASNKYEVKGESRHSQRASKPAEAWFRILGIYGRVTLSVHAYHGRKHPSCHCNYKDHVQYRVDYRCTPHCGNSRGKNITSYTKPISWHLDLRCMHIAETLQRGLASQTL